MLPAVVNGARDVRAPVRVQQGVPDETRLIEVDADAGSLVVVAPVGRGCSRDIADFIVVNQQVTDHRPVMRCRTVVPAERHGDGAASQAVGMPDDVVSDRHAITRHDGR